MVPHPQLLLFIIVLFISETFSHPPERRNTQELRHHKSDNLHRALRSLQPARYIADDSDHSLTRIRTRRSSEECEKLSLCKLHANSQRSFVGTFQLYFVNKENAHLWDHGQHTVEECEQMYSGCYDNARTHSVSARAPTKNFRTDYYDDDYSN